MKLKKGILRGLIIALGTIILSFGLNYSVNAATANNTLYLGLEQYRASGYSYKTINKVMWKISSYDDASGANVNKNRNIYCIKAGPGFGSTDMGGSYVGAINIRPYTQAFDFKDLSSITGNYLNALPTGANYNSLVWVLEHCYVPGLTTSSEYRTELLNAAGVTNSTISDDEIDVAQQLAIWYFTNTDNYKIQNGTFYYDVKEKADADYISIEDKFTDGGYRMDDSIALFNYLVNQGTANANVTPKKTNTSNPISINASNAKITLESGNYILGPYSIDKTSSTVVSAVADADYTLEATLKNGSTSIPFKILDSNKQEAQLKDTVGSSFYISVAANSYVSSAQFTVTTKTYETTLTYWAVANAPTTDQPVVEIDRKANTYEIPLITPSKPEEKLFDLSLRKFITNINGKDVLDENGKLLKEPIVDVTPLINSTSTTAIYKHRKDPISVAVGDEVIYTIRVYNEGELDGYVTEITDYLPAQLEFVNDSFNQERGWSVSSNGRIVKTTKTSGTLLKAFAGTSLDYVDIQVKCKVKYVEGLDTTITNIAEITGFTDSDGNTVKDRDSEKENLNLPTDTNLPDYKGKDTNKSDLSDNNYYYEGQEDDDDFDKLILKEFDLSLRKFITEVNNQKLLDSNGKYAKEPIVDVTKLANGTSTTATYKHRKDPVGVAIGDEVIYTIRVYNEGEVDGYVTEITDYLPEQLEFVNDEFNAQYGWSVSSDGRKIKTSITSLNTANSANRDAIYATRENGVLLKAFDGTNLDYIDVQVKCKVKDVESLDTVITNIAEITGFTDSNGNIVKDRDSEKENLNLPADENLPDYKGKDSNKSILNDSNYYYEGQEDDDDFDKLVLQEFDLALRKFITGVNDEAVTNRYPVFTTDKDENGNYIYKHTKEPVLVETTDLVEYTIRIYNEGNIAGYAKEVKDDIPSGLEFVPTDETNVEYRWTMLDADGNKTTDASKAKYITTDYLSKEQEKVAGSNLISGFDTNTMSTPAYKDVKAVFKVVAPNSYDSIITNTAEISDDSDENGNPVIDRDSTPNNDNKKEDDIDVEHIKLTYFDLALRKFITAVDEDEVTNRYPVFSIDENGNYVYTHTKEPVEVENGNIVTYTLRIYNEGTKAGYAKQVKDDLPEGLEFLPENETNTEYRWIMLDEDGNETDDISKAVSIATDYLSKEQEDETGRDNLLIAFDDKTMDEPDYRDIKIAFKVTEPNTSDRILINKAQISDDSDEDGNDVVDKDSTPDKWIEGEDDQDIEKVKVKYFDLALRKWVTQAIVIEDGKEKVTETGHKAEDDPEEVVKVEIEKSKLNKVVVKFRYKIRITNEGEIAGYAKEISDYIPDGLKFVAADNPLWKEADGKIVTTQLADTLLQPGETAEVEVLLTWINGSDNMGLKVNVAEISEDYNDSHTPDIDSTPNNKKEGEDDIDDAPVILSTKTGELVNTQYILLAAGSLAIISAGIVLIKKYVL